MSKIRENPLSKDVSAPSSGWQPSARDASIPTYSGTLTGSYRTAPSSVLQDPYRRGWIAVATLALVGLFLLGLTLLKPPPDPPATVPPPIAPSVAVFEVLRGTVSIATASAGEPRPQSAWIGQALTAGAVIETGATSPPRVLSSTVLSTPIAAGAGRAPTSTASRAAFRLTTGPSVRLDHDSRVRLASGSTLVLERGAVYVDAQSSAGVEVRTALGVVRDIGTQFEVRLLSAATDTLRVRVREGSIVLQPEDGTAHQADAGVELALNAAGVLERSQTPVHGSHWDWVLEATPIPAIEGQSLRTFLDWRVREGGWTLRFANAETAALATRISLHGNVAELTPSEATAMVLQSSNLDYAVTDGTLLVTPRGTAR